MGPGEWNGAFVISYRGYQLVAYCVSNILRGAHGAGGMERARLPFPTVANIR